MCCGMATVERAVEIDTNQTVPLVGRAVDDWSLADVQRHRATGAIHQCIDAALLLCNLREYPLHIGQHAHIQDLHARRR